MRQLQILIGIYYDDLTKLQNVVMDYSSILPPNNQEDPSRDEDLILGGLMR